MDKIAYWWKRVENVNFKVTFALVISRRADRLRDENDCVKDLPTATEEGGREYRARLIGGLQVW